MTAVEAERPAGPPAPMPTRTGLYALLLGLAGRVPDDRLAEMRLCLADGEERELASLLASSIAGGRLGLSAAEALLVRDLLRECDAGSGLAGDAPRIESPPAPYRFGDPYGVAIPTGDGRPGRADPADAAVIAAGERVGGLQGIWRVFRHSHEGPPRRVYLAEARPDADVAELTAEAQYALGEAGEDPPRAEVFAEGTPLPPYHQAALDGATLVWAAAGASVRLARAFDGADPERGPYFAAGHPRLAAADGERVLAYLRSGEVVLGPPGGLDDVLDAGGRGVVPAGFRSDGRWVWPEAVAYYLKRHGLAPEPDLVAHALTGAAVPRPLSRLTRHRVLTTLFAPTGGEPAWQAG